MLLADSQILLIVVLLVLPLLGVIVMFNGHVSRRNAVEYAFSSIDVQLKKRWDLIPGLVETARGYAKHEREVFERVVQARAQAQASEGEERFRWESSVAQELPKLIALRESYPELKSDAHFLHLQRNLTEIESQISAARRAYNAAITDYNDGVQMFPSSVVAGMFGFKKRAWFQIEASEQEVKRV